MFVKSPSARRAAVNFIGFTRIPDIFLNLQKVKLRITEKLRKLLAKNALAIRKRKRQKKERNKKKRRKPNSIRSIRQLT